MAETYWVSNLIGTAVMVGLAFGVCVGWIFFDRRR